ncbi:MAG: polyphosphate kinase 1, partial [Oscillospiraceae bacterium]
APLYKLADKAYQSIEQSMRLHDIYNLEINELAKSEKKFIDDYFRVYVLPVLSPQIIDSNHPFPHLENKALSVVALLKNNGKSIFAIIPIPNWLPLFVMLPGTNVRYVMMEKIFFHYAQNLFKVYEMADKAIVCVTRNADIKPDDEVYDVNEDFRQRMKKILKKRARLAAVRLEIDGNKNEDIVKYMCDRLSIQRTQVFKSDSPINMKYVFSLRDKFPETQKALEYQPYSPLIPPYINSKEKMIKQIQKQDILLYYPYDSMEPFLRLLKEAAQNTDVISIKITIYRLDKNSNIVEHLIAASENKIDVTVLMELRARFDEENNIEWAEKLIAAGCKVIYGSDGFKVHSKICLITYREKNTIKYITQIGTGNYNEKTAKLYTDICLMTANEAISEDANHFFNNMAISDLNGEYSTLLVAPQGIEAGFMALIDQEIAKKQDGKIIIKANSLTHRAVIDKLAEASQAGVDIKMIIRGICCILPNVKDKTENISVMSVVGRFLEHARIYIFGEKMYISSADLMTRNLVKRVEIACPILDELIKKQILNDIDLILSDNVKGRILQSDGSYTKPAITGQIVDSQMTFIKGRLEAAEQALQNTEPDKLSVSKKIRDFIDKMLNHKQ